jgi:DNA-binding transcriptional regulator LsrR (DeoR family)
MEAELSKLLYKIARAYYDDGLTQQQIADEFGVSRVKVNRLLVRAKDEGIVRIQVVAPQDNDADSERRLEEAYGLQEVVLVPAPRGERALLDALGAGAASYLARVLKANDTVAMAWGNTLSAVVDRMGFMPLPGSRVVQLLGGLGNPEDDVHSMELARRMAQKLQARLRPIPAPGIVKTRRIRDAFLNDDTVSAAIRLAAHADVALVGVGTLDQRSLVVRAGTILSPAEVRQLRAEGVVGDVALRFFDAEGRQVQDEINARVIGVTAEELKAMRRVVAVAGGASKQAAILGALRSGLVDVLISDEATGAALLKASDRDAAAATRQARSGN